MSGVERVFPGARAGTECSDLGSIKRKGCQVRGESKEGAAASWFTCAPPSLPVCSLLDQQQASGTHLSGFTALFFFGLKNERGGEIEEGRR